MKIDDAIKFFEEAAKASARLGTEKLELGAIAHIAYDTYSQIAEWLKELKQRRTIDVASEWIPCSERMPSEVGNYLVTVKWAHSESVETCDWNGDRWDAWDVGMRDYVVAWMPLPKPYGERKDQ